jgi:hypothetical protein
MMIWQLFMMEILGNYTNSDGGGACAGEERWLIGTYSLEEDSEPPPKDPR